MNYCFKNHVVIIGNDRMSVSLIKQLADKYPKAEIVLQTVLPVPGVRHGLFSNLQSGIEKRITIVSGNRTSVEDLQRLHIEKSLEVFILGENDEYDNDSLNIECLKRINSLLSVRETLLRCNVLFEYQSTFAVFQQQDIDEIREHIDFVPFNYYETWAYQVFVRQRYEITSKQETLPTPKSSERSFIEYMPLDHQPLTADSDKNVHLVIIGMSGMGIAMSIQAAHICHFPNFITKGIKTRITFIDEQADREMSFLTGRYPYLFNEVDYFYHDISQEGTSFDNTAVKEKFTDIEFEFIKGSVAHPKVREYIATTSSNEKSYVTIAVCFSFPPQAIAAGLYLPGEVYERQIPVIISQETSYSVIAMLSKQKGENAYRKYANVKPFGMLDNCYDIEKAKDIVPMLINYAYETKQSEQFPDDEVKAKWIKLSTALKWSNRYNVGSISVKKRSFGIEEITQEEMQAQLELLAEVEHNRWNIEKLFMGFRTTSPDEKEEIRKYGSKFKEYKNNKLAHNYICAYRNLPDDVKDYDRIISLTLPKLINYLNKQI
jgi:hypothetical protein